MDRRHIEEYGKIPQPDRSDWHFLKELQEPLSYHFQPGHGCAPGKTADCLARGAELILPEKAEVPETALESFRRVLKAKSIEERGGGYPIRFEANSKLGKEEFHVRADVSGVLVSASDTDGFRRGVYFLEDRIREAEGASVTEGEWQRKPYIRHRISRCFFGPTNRPPFRIDELTNEIDYYPDEYLNRLAHEGINGLWLTMYFRDLPSSIFPGRGADFEKRVRKLKWTVKKCARYGIRIVVFLSEPKRYGAPFQPVEETAEHPEILGSAYHHHGLDLRMFCTSSETGLAYLRECTETIFSAVPELGGIINIMLGEDNGSCAAFETTEAEPIPPEDRCPRCSKRDHAEIFREQAQMYSEAIRKYNPEAEYIGWFYAPRQHDGSPFMKRLKHIAEKWPEEASLMFNFESGGTSMQLGRKRVVLDYSLAYVGPSELFAEAAKIAPRTAAKLQVGCSHEDASIPFIPVPANLYEKYAFLHKAGVSSVMQCWYFGNYPGLMNKAAGELSFEPFPGNDLEFLTELARPDWRSEAETAARAWKLFSEAYRTFPSNLNFEWYGPLHHCIAWPLHLFPVDEPISPSWLLKQYPEVSGDRVGECFGFFHTLAEGLTLCREMSRLWQEGLALLTPLRKRFVNDPERLADIRLAEAVGLQMQSTCCWLEFYSLREDMFFYKRDHLAEMRKIVEDEIAHTRAMRDLCRTDSRLGYHPEAEGYLFFPAKLEARIKLLQELLTDDFPRFSLQDDRIRIYTGEDAGGVPSCVIPREGTQIQQGRNLRWSGTCDGTTFELTVYGARHRNFTLGLEPCRLWPLFLIDFFKDDSFHVTDVMFTEPPEAEVRFEGDDVVIRIPLELFRGIRREGFPMRMNIWSKEDRFWWTEPHFLKEGRLQFGSIIPEGFGWIHFS